MTTRLAPLVLVVLLVPSACVGLVNEAGRPCPCDDTAYMCCRSTQQCIPRTEASLCGDDAAGALDVDGADASGAADAPNEEETAADGTFEDRTAAEGTVPDGAADPAVPDGTASDGYAPDTTTAPDGGDATATVPADASQESAPAPTDARPDTATAAVCPALDATSGVNVATTAYGYGLTMDAVGSSTQRVVWTATDDGSLTIDGFDFMHLDAGMSHATVRPPPDGGAGLPRRLVTAIAVNPWNDLEALVAMTGQSGGAPNLFRTSNGGLDWVQVRAIADAGITEVWSVSYNPLGPSYVYAVGAPDGTAAASGDSGATWGVAPASGDPIAVGAPGTMVTSAALGREDLSYVVAGTSDGQVWVTTNGAQGPWAWVNDPTSFPEGSAPMPRRPITRVLANPRLSPPTLVVTYVEQAADSVWISGTGGYLWQAIPTGLPNTEPDPAYAYFGASLDLNTLSTVTSNGANLYLHLNGTCGTAFSPDEGAHWFWHPAGTP